MSEQKIAQPNVISQPGPAKYLRLWQRRRVKIAALIIVAALLLAAGFLAWYRHHSIYHYSKLNTYTLPSKLPGSAISISIPVEYKQVSQTVIMGESDAHLEQKKGNQTIGYISITSTPNALAASPSYVSSFNDAMAYAANSKTKDTQKGILLAKTETDFRSYLLKNLPSGYTGIGYLSKPVISSFTGPHISKNAWYTEFAAIGVNKPELKGLFMFMMGKRTYYYVSIAVPYNNLNPNNVTWDGVSDSIKIDQ